MEFKVHQKLRDAIDNEERDIALITAPGMGLTTLLDTLSKIRNSFAIYIETQTLIDFWENDFKNRPHNKRFIIHAATIHTFLDSGIINGTLEREYIFHTNLKNFLNDFNVANQAVEKFYVVIDNFDELPEDLEKIILDELKVISDNKGQGNEYQSLNCLRYIIGGCVDFRGMYDKNSSGVSPATQFCKYYPYDFLLSSAEIEQFIHSEYPKITKVPEIFELVCDWSGGYLFYVEEFAKWISNQIKEKMSSTVETLIVDFKREIEENNKISIFQYCRPAWEVTKSDDNLMDMLYRTAKTGIIWDISSYSKRLMKMGLLLEQHFGPQSNIFQIPNRIVELFLRQRFSELGLLLPISDSAIWGMKHQNLRSYSTLFDIENHLRNFIGDSLYKKSPSNWLSRMDILAEDGTNILGKIRSRYEANQDSIYATSEFSDPLISYLDFGDLAAIIEQNKSDFPKEFSEKAPNFLRELNFHRRRIAHSRPMTIEQINSVEIRWKQIRKLMMKRN